MRKRIFVILTTTIFITLCLVITGFYFYNIYYNIDLSQFNYSFLSRIVDSPDGKFQISISIFKTSEDSEDSYIKGDLISVSKQKDVPSKTIKTVFWQKVDSSDIKNKWIDDVWLDNWVDVFWLDEEIVKINNITIEVFRDVYDYRRNW